uniref:ubiquitin carboxyl-terminal hydrolase 32-like n=1 Tax=Oncorhynchus gorbuscha TaxID=8017 RepID=UPI001EAF283E|nr:ubiquitin carboxyl-terminal hydrolase 32-like [Oncorhynchus gorbuscha]
MGAKESRIGFLSYDEAIKRVTDVELKRLKDAFKRTSGLSYYMAQQCFYREVLGDGVPPKVAEVIYNSFGGTSKGLHFNNLIIGLVLLTRGRDGEKAKYLFSLFASESGGYAARDDMEAVLRALDGEVPPSLRKCFSEGEKVNYERFKTWLLQNTEAFTFSRWLLSGGVCVTLTDDSDTPTFYQTLAGVTHLEESDIIDLEKRYWLLKAQSRTGRFDLETFVPLVSPPIHASLSEGLFHAFDENRDNHIDFKEISCGLSACCRGPVAERQKFCFKVFDVDRDGVLSRDEIQEMVAALLEVWKDNRTDTLPELLTNVSDIVEGILKMHDTTKLGHLTLEDYQIWSVNSALANEFLNLLFQVCHIVLGLRPATAEEEGQIIRGWLDREGRHGLQPGENWFLISSQWWTLWKDYVKYDRKSIVVDQPSIFSSLRNPQASATVEPSPLEPGVGEGLGVASPASTSEERSPDAVSSASEATETQSTVVTPQAGPSATEICFARQHNMSDNNQCFSGANGHIPSLSQSQLAAQRPGAIDNQPLVNTDPMKAPTLTMEGGRLKQSLQLVAGRDFETVPEPVWRALFHWYGANLSLPRPVIQQTKTGRAELELFPRYLLFLRQQPATRTPQSNIWVNMGMTSLRMFPQHLPRGNLFNKDMSWKKRCPSSPMSKMDRHKVATEKGATGLSNLGNTCFMNSSIQCVSNTTPLTDYFISGRHLYELNRTNPIGMRGHMAKCYGDLLMELWSGTQRNVAPLKLRWTIAKYAPRFNGFQQQDSQELLAFLLDGLHEDLNRVHEKPYVELKDSNGRPDWEVALEAWENHLRRNRSIVVDLFHGQLKSQVKCKSCGHISALWFNFLSLPLPMDSSMHLEITVIMLDGSTPVRFGLRLNMDDKYTGLKKQLSELCSLKPEQILLAEVHTSNIKNFPQDNHKVRLSVNGFLCAFEIPVPGSPSSLTSPTQTDITPVPMVNGVGVAAHPDAKPGLISNGMPSTMVHCRETTERSLANGHVSPAQDSPFIGYIIAMHRKMMRTELYFLSSQKNRASLFGMPLIVPCTVHTSQKDLYDAVWIQVARLASPLPPQEASNHAQDCDDSMGYQYPFTLRVVGKDGNSCAWCPWYRFCRGCAVDCTEDRASVGNACIAVDWDPTALHLRYQTSQERIVEEHCSVQQSRRAQAEPISLDSCLKAFTSEEELGEDELYYCSKCKTHRLATKKLDLWRLPPILIVHLKRFQFVNGRWIKSQKIVQFPRERFDPSVYLAPREAGLNGLHSLQSRSEGEELLRIGGGETVSSISAPAGFLNILKASPASGRKSAPPSSISCTSSPCSSPKTGGGSGSTGHRQTRLRLPQLGSRHRLSNSKENLEGSTREGGSDSDTEPREGRLQADTEDGLVGVRSEPDMSTTDAFSSLSDVIVMNGDTEASTAPSTNLETPTTTLLHQRDNSLENIYNLYAISCHSGIMGGGHYVTYAKNPNNKWYCYNDSSCKEVHSEEMDTDSAYILFYEQQAVDFSQFLPKTDGKKMADTTSMDEDFESDYKKYCVLQ